jgi:hypothetical protein
MHSTQHYTHTSAEERYFANYKKSNLFNLLTLSHGRGWKALYGILKGKHIATTSHCPSGSLYPK